MPRLRALVLFGLFAVNQAACTTWQAPQVTPQAYVAQHPGTKIRVTQKDSSGRWLTGTGVVLTGARFSDDSISGRGPGDQRMAFSLQQVAQIEVHKVSGGATAMFVVFVGLIAAGVAFLVALGNDQFLSP